jgi:hypothetical protein
VIARIITYLICGGFAAMFLYVGATQFWQQRRNLANAESVDATIVHSTVTVSTTRDTDGRVGFSNSTTSYSPDVRFTYRVGGQQYESARLNPTIIGTGYASEESAAAELAAYPLNAKVRAWVNPAHPEQAFLNGEKSNGPIVFLILGLVMPVVGYFVGKIV